MMEEFTQEELGMLSHFFSNVDRPVFALINMPEVVKGALFARYSRSSKSLRRLFLDEFADTVALGTENLKSVATSDPENAKKLFERVFVEYGDDSVAQLGGAHLAVEGISNIATKLLERGRIMSYLEQSTRYIRYDQPRNGSYLYMTPQEISDLDVLEKYHESMEQLFRSYGAVTDSVKDYFTINTQSGSDGGSPAWRRAVLAASLDAARGILPASTISNVGVYGSGQAYEALLLRLYANPLFEAQEMAQAILRELATVIPSFVKRVDRPERGGVWIEYLANKNEVTEQVVKLLYGSSASKTLGCVGNNSTGVTVRLVDFDPLGEEKILTAVAQEASNLPWGAAWVRTTNLSEEEKSLLFRSYCGERSNRRHRPGRAFENTTYTFEVESDYGAFRDLQRHRMLTLDWQTPTVLNGYIRPDVVNEAGCGSEYDKAMEVSHSLHSTLERFNPAVAQYATCMAHRVRYTITMNARELMHIAELRSAPQGHPAYRTVAQMLHTLVGEVAGHQNVADSMIFMDHSNDSELGRLEAEKLTEAKRNKNL